MHRDHVGCTMQTVCGVSSWLLWHSEKTGHPARSRPQWWAPTVLQNTGTGTQSALMGTQAASEHSSEHPAGSRAPE